MCRPQKPAGILITFKRYYTGLVSRKGLFITAKNTNLRDSLVLFQNVRGGIRLSTHNIFFIIKAVTVASKFFAGF